MWKRPISIDATRSAMQTIISALLALLAMMISASSGAARDCIRITWGADNIVFAINQCKFPLVAKIVDKRGNEMGVTKIIAPGKKVSIERMVAPSDFAYAKSYCKVKDGRPCKPK